MNGSTATSLAQSLELLDPDPQSLELLDPDPEPKQLAEVLMKTRGQE